MTSEGGISEKESFNFFSYYWKLNAYRFSKLAWGLFDVVIQEFCCRCSECSDNHTTVGGQHPSQTSGCQTSYKGLWGGGKEIWWYSWYVNKVQHFTVVFNVEKVGNGMIFFCKKKNVSKDNMPCLGWFGADYFKEEITLSLLLWLRVTCGVALEPSRKLNWKDQSTWTWH